uniref:Uncharacterized protein n=1 Tax=Octopus bimaculoides TaxID=37653 RepID=A0A0L8IC11_OCTBM
MYQFFIADRRNVNMKNNKTANLSTKECFGMFLISVKMSFCFAYYFLKNIYFQSCNILLLFLKLFFLFLLHSITL